MSFIKEHRKIIASRILKSLQKRQIEAYFCESKAEACDKVFSFFTKDDFIGTGGSETLGELGIKDKLRDEGYNFTDRDDPNNDTVKLGHLALNSDYYLMSSSAITVDGEIINRDGNGNRLAALMFGPKNVIIVIGMNKVVKDVDEGIKRIDRISAPVNAIRLSTNTPCTKLGVCQDCFNENSVCAHTVITRFSRQKNRIKVILVNENLGF